jgi:hypothetical protein
MTRSFWLFVVLLVSLRAAPSEAQPRGTDSYALPSVGFVGSASFTGESSLGLEASLPFLVGFTHSDFVIPRGFGPVAQWQRLHGRDRFMLGLEYVSLLGVEVGWSLRETSRGRAQGVQVTPFISLGLVSAGPTLFVPLTETGFDVGLNFYAKIPLRKL